MASSSAATRSCKRSSPGSKPARACSRSRVPGGTGKTRLAARGRPPRSSPQYPAGVFLGSGPGPAARSGAGHRRPSGSQTLGAKDGLAAHIARAPAAAASPRQPRAGDRGRRRAVSSAPLALCSDLDACSTRVASSSAHPGRGRSAPPLACLPSAAVSLFCERSRPGANRRHRPQPRARLDSLPARRGARRRRARRRSRPPRFFAAALAAGSISLKASPAPTRRQHTLRAATIAWS